MGVGYGGTVIILLLLGLPTIAAVAFSLRFRTCVLIGAVFMIVSTLVNTLSPVDEKTSHLAMYQMAQDLDKAVERSFPADPELHDSLVWGKLPRLMGQICGMGAGALLLGAIFWGPGALLRRLFVQRSLLHPRDETASFVDVRPFTAGLATSPPEVPPGPTSAEPMDGDFFVRPPTQMRGGTSRFRKRLAISAASLAACYLLVGPAARWWGRQVALREVRRDATMQHAPEGLLGAKWLMSKSEILATVQEARDAGRDPAGDEVVVATGTAFGRNAAVSFHIRRGFLVLIVITFQGTPSETSFDETQKRLIAEFGDMPRAEPYDGSLLTSKKTIDRFAVYHELKKVAGSLKEGVLLYRIEERR